VPGAAPSAGGAPPTAGAASSGGPGALPRGTATARWPASDRAPVTPVRASPAQIARATELTRVAYGAYLSAAPAGGRRQGGTGGLRRARRLLDSAAAVAPVPDVYLLRARVAMRLDDLRDAWSDAETGSRLGKPWQGQTVMAMVDAAAIDTAAGRARVAPLVADVRRRTGPIPAGEGGYLALALVALGNRERAVEVLRRVPTNDPELRVLLRDPGFRRIRNDPRLAKLPWPRGR
jgi:hypothetical protein